MDNPTKEEFIANIQRIAALRREQRAHMTTLDEEDPDIDDYPHS